MAFESFKSEVSLTLAVERCIGCGKCVDACQEGVFSLADGKARIVEKDLCLECGACARACPSEAIKVNMGLGFTAAFALGWLMGGDSSGS